MKRFFSLFNVLIVLLILFGCETVKGTTINKITITNAISSNKTTSSTIITSNEKTTTKLEHTHEFIKADFKASTCTEVGNIEYYYCNDCEKYFIYNVEQDEYEEIKEQDIIISSHNVVHMSQKDYTCEIDGNIEYYYCTECEKYYTDSECAQAISYENTVLKAACRLNKVDYKASTCTEVGNIEYYICNLCGKFYEDNDGKKLITIDDTIISKTNHHIVTGEYNNCCDVCGVYETIYYDNSVYSSIKIIEYNINKKAIIQNYDNLDFVISKNYFDCWNTKADGTGDNYYSSEEYNSLPNVLYAQYKNLISVVDKDGLVKTYSSINNIIIEDNNTIIFAPGTYEGDIQITCNNVIIKGNYYGIDGNSTDRLENKETAINGKIILNNSACIGIDGILFEGENGVCLIGSTSDISISNCIFRNTGNLSIYDLSSETNNEFLNSNIVISNNLFISQNTEYSKDISLNNYIKNITIQNNVFSNNISILNENDYPIKINKIANDSKIIILGNKFLHKGANYLVSLMEENGEENRSKVNIVIENNTGFGCQTTYLGNGFKILYLNNESSVKFIHNTEMMFNRYYNAIYFSNSSSCSSTFVIDDQNPKIDIMYNIIYGDANSVNTPERKTTLSNNYIEIGLGIPADTEKVKITKNYFVGTPRCYAYGTNESKSSFKCSYNAGVITQLATYNDIEKLENDYYVYSEFYSILYDYKAVCNNLDTSINAYYNGKDSLNILNYINNFNKLYYDKFEIQKGELVYIGNDNDEESYAIELGISTKESLIIKKEETYKDSIINIAYQYYYQGIEIQYDMKNKRRNMYATPEDATSYRGIYLDCSSYVNSVYYNLFGIDIIELDSTYTMLDTNNINKYALDKYGYSNDVIIYNDTTDFSAYTDAEKDAYLKQYWDSLEIGDLVCYRHGSTSGTNGHIMLYIGNDKFLHCTGSSFDLVANNPTESKDNATTIEKTKGAIQLLDAKYVFTKTTSSYNTRYLFNSGLNGTSADTSKKVWSFCIIRPLNRTNLQYTSQAVARMNNSNILIEKISNPAHMSSVKIGDTITYTISITNKNSTSVKNIEIKDYIADNVKLISSSVVPGTAINNNELYYKVSSVSAGSTYKYTYSVIVLESPNGTFINSSSCTINGLLTNGIYHIISACVDNNEIISYAKSKIGTTYTNVFDFYYDVWNKENIDISNNLSSETALWGLIYDGLNKTPIYDMLVPDLYGGTLLSFKDSNMIRLVEDKYLEPGDIILTRYNNSSNTKVYQYFMYVNESCILEVVKTENGYTIQNNINTTSDVDTFLLQLIAYMAFSVLRPSLLN